ncbi:MAG TPA: cupin fold metalloprotein, WbuC family, partial [Magnetococcales bacterium]|nr:cupin fold metalloprotein, WbuC family [Magnetococcales bacterium]
MPLSIAEINPEVLVSLGEVTLVDDPFVQFLKARGEHTVNRRIRLCAHPGADDPLHEMMIVLFGSSYIPPHAHRGKSESFHMIEGAADVILFTADGTPEQALHLSEIRGGGHFYYRLGSDRFHTIIPRTSCVVF